MCKVSPDLVQLTYMFDKSPPIPELEVQFIAAKVMLYCGQGRHGRRTRQKQTIGSDAEAAGGDACIARKLSCTLYADYGELRKPGTTTPARRTCSWDQVSACSNHSSVFRVGLWHVGQCVNNSRALKSLADQLSEEKGLLLRLGSCSKASDCTRRIHPALFSPFTLPFTGHQVVRVGHLVSHGPSHRSQDDLQELETYQKQQLQQFHDCSSQGPS